MIENKKVERSLQVPLVFFADFVGVTRLTYHPYASPFPFIAPFYFLLPISNCFLKVWRPTLFAAVMKYFLSQITPAISGSADSNRPAPTRFAEGRYIYSTVELRFTLCNWTESPSTLSTNTPIDWNLYLSWSKHRETSVSLEKNAGGFS